MKKVAVVIVNWNGKSNTLECLRSLSVTAYPKPFDIIVVDNSSTDNSVSTIRRHFANVYLLPCRTNLGFSGANNEGIRLALRRSAEYIFIVNNDTLFASNTIVDLVQSMECRSTCGIAGPKIYFAPGYEFHKQRYKQKEYGKVIWYAGGIIDWANVAGFHRGVDEVDYGQYNKEEETDFVSGCAMMVKRSVFEKVGIFDERFYLYYEDLDFNIRTKKAGFSLIYVPSSILWHKNAGSSHSGSNLQDYYLTRNRLLFGFRYAKLSTKLSLLKESVRLARVGRPWQKRGVVDALVGRWGKGSYVKP